MNDTPPVTPNTDAGPGSAVPWLWALTLIAVVGGAAVAGYVLTRSEGLTPEQAAEIVANAAPETVPLGNDYYVYVKLIEMRPTRDDGTPWDRFSGTAPDPFYRMSWQGVQVFESPERDDAFIAGWDLLSVDLKDVVLKQEGEVDIESIVNAPTIRIEQGTTVTVEVIDDDTVDNTEAGTVKLELDQFRLGTNALAFTPEEQPNLSRMVVGIVDRNISLPELLDAVSER